MTGTQRLSGRQSNIFWLPLPRFLRKPQPDLTDGRAELAVAYHVHELLLQLPAMSQARVLHHVEGILKENAEQLAEFDRAIANGE